MAQLKDLLVTGASRLLGDIYANKIQITTINAPTTAAGTVYGAGNNGQVLKSDGSGVYWGVENNSNISINSGTANKIAYYSGENTISAASNLEIDNTITRLTTTSGTPGSFRVQSTDSENGSKEFGLAFSSNGSTRGLFDYTSGATGWYVSWNDDKKLVLKSEDKDHYLPNQKSWLVGAGNGTSTGAGNTNIPVYVTTAGIATAVTSINTTLIAAASTAGAGLMTADMVTKFNTIDTNANNYSLPTASSSVLGGVKIGSDLNISNTGVLSVKHAAKADGINIQSTTNGIACFSNTAGTVKSIATAKGAAYATAANGVLTFGTLPVTEGGSGLTAAPSLLVNLAVNTTANVFSASPRPGVTGVLGLANGGLGTTDVSVARTTLGLGSLAIKDSLDASDIPDIAATKITGTFTAAQIPDIDLASKVTGILSIKDGGTSASDPYIAINNLNGLPVYKGVTGIDDTTTNTDLIYNDTTKTFNFSSTKTFVGAVGFSSFPHPVTGVANYGSLLALPGVATTGYGAELLLSSISGATNYPTLSVRRQASTGTWSPWLHIGAGNNGIVYCPTSSTTRAKIGICTNFVLKAHSYYMVHIENDNTYSSNYLTLNVNGTGAKRIYINGTTSGTSNHTLPAGDYLVWYSGNYYYFNTDSAMEGDFGRVFGTSGTAGLYGPTLPSGSEGRIFFQTTSTTDPAVGQVNTIAATANSSYYLIGALTDGVATPYIATANSSGTKNKNGVRFNGSTGVLLGAAWNDYAEFRQKKDIVDIPYGKVVIENGDDTVSLSTERLQPCGQIISDTYGFILGPEENALPIALCGRVLAYPYEDRSSFDIGDAVCTGPNGKVSKMTREEIRLWPDRIIGYVSSIPSYEIWEEKDIKVDGRIWIKVK